MRKLWPLLFVVLAGCDLADADELLFGSPTGSGVISIPFDATQSPGCMSWDGTNIDTNASNPNCTGGGGSPVPTQTPWSCGAGNGARGMGSTPDCFTVPTPDGAGGAAQPTQTAHDCGAGNYQRGHNSTPICVVAPTPDGNSGGATPGAGTPQPIATSTNAPGSADGFARVDHVHAIADGAIGAAKLNFTVPTPDGVGATPGPGTPQPIATSTSAPGSAAGYARVDHVHAIADGSIGDAKITSAGITTRTKLPSQVCYEDEANTFSQLLRLDDTSFRTDAFTDGVTWDPATKILQADDGTLRANDVACGSACVDISSETNLTASSGVTLTGDNLTATLGTTIAPTEMASSDFGSFTCNGTTCSLDAGSVGTAEASGLDISSDTNLAATSPIVLTGDTLSFAGIGIEEGNVSVDATTLTVDFNATSFDVSCASDECDVSLAANVMTTSTAVSTSQLPTIAKNDDQQLCFGTDADFCFEYDTTTGWMTATASTAPFVVTLGPGPTSTPGATPTAVATPTSGTPTITASPTPVPMILPGANRLGIDGDIILTGNADRAITMGPCNRSPCAGKDLSITGAAASAIFNGGYIGGGITITTGAGANFGQAGALGLTIGTGGGNITLTSRRNSIVGTVGGKINLLGDLISTIAPGATAPTVGTCGTSPTIDAQATNNAGRVTVGTGGTASACTVTFGNSGFTNTPVCTVSFDTAANGCLRAQPSTTTLIITNYDCAASPAARAYAASAVLNYVCVGR